jgi:hypothetical protein
MDTLLVAGEIAAEKAAVAETLQCLPACLAADAVVITDSFEVLAIAHG